MQDALTLSHAAANHSPSDFDVSVRRVKLCNLQVFYHDIDFRHILGRQVFHKFHIVFTFYPLRISAYN